MFSGPLNRLQLGIRGIKAAVEMHEYARRLFFEGTGETGEVDVWEPVRTLGLAKLSWQIYDYCAAITRLYALYSTFIEDLVAAYLRMLPSLFDNYELLPASIKTQHRIGSAQILLKIGKSGPFRHLREDDVWRVMGGAVGGSRPYTLLEKAFFVENQRQNYRLDALARIVGSLGIKGLGSRIAGHGAMRDFLERARGGGTTFEAELNRFVQLRNEAAHTEVEQLIASEELKALGDFIWTLCTILAETFETEVIARRFALGHLALVGTVTEVYRKGLVVVLKARPTRVTVGDQVAIVSKGRLALSHILSIQDFGTDLDTIDPAEGQEVGLGLDRPCSVGNMLAKVPPAAEYAIDRVPPAEAPAEELYEGTESDDMVGADLSRSEEGGPA